MGRLENKVAVITGGNSGIGLAAAKAFQREGAKLVLFGRNRETLGEAVRDLGEGTIAVAGDVTNAEDLDGLMGAVGEEHGRIDILFANAGVAHFVPLAEADAEHFDLHFGINVKGAYFTVRKALPLLREGSSVIFTSSGLDRKGMAGSSVYSATKAAIRSFARTLAAELAPQGIRVNTIAPGPIDTPIHARSGLSEEEMAGMAESVSAMVPLGRFGTAEEIAEPVVYLASDESSYMTGAELYVDGGIAQV